MKNLTSWFLLGLLSLGCSAWTHAEDAALSAEKAVLALEKLWEQSQKTNNPDLIAPHLADTLVYTSTDGKMDNKAGLLASARASKYSSVDYTDIKVTVYGDAAITTGGLTGAWTDPAGKSINATERWTDTWVKMPDGTWKCVATHSSPVAK